MDIQHANKYKNPWYKHREFNSTMKEFYNHGPLARTVYTSPCGRGRILKVYNNQFDFLINDRVVTMRAGWKNTGKQILQDTIAFILDGATDLETKIWDLERCDQAYRDGE